MPSACSAPTAVPVSAAIENIVAADITQGGACLLRHHLQAFIILVLRRYDAPNRYKEKCIRVNTLYYVA
jgi:hypothetical protein